MKACPGPRTRIDSRHSFRHSSESWNPEGVGGVRPPDDGKNPPVTTIFILLCGPLRSMVIPAEGRNPGGGVGAASFHTLVCRRQPAWSDYYESMSRTPIRDSRLNRISMPILPPGVDTIIRRHRHFYVANVSRMPQLWGVGQGNVARGLVPRLVPATPGEPDNSGPRRNPRKARTAQPSRTLESLSDLHQLVQDHCFKDIM